MAELVLRDQRELYALITIIRGREPYFLESASAAKFIPQPLSCLTYPIPLAFL